MTIAKIKQGDHVQVIAGKDKGRQGEVLRVIECEKRNGLLIKKIIVDGIALQSKHVKANPNKDEEGGIKKIPRAIDISNVVLFDQATNNMVKVAVRTLENGKRVRVNKKTGEVITDNWS